jgi:hypothetical protein
MTFLDVNTAKPSVRCITINIEGLCDVRLCQHRRCSQQLLQGLERFITLGISDKFLIFLQKIRDEFGNLGEVQNESAIVAWPSRESRGLDVQSLAASNLVPLKPCPDPRTFLLKI